jgi:hypothetical protein
MNHAKRIVNRQNSLMRRTPNVPLIQRVLAHGSYHKYREMVIIRVELTHLITLPQNYDYSSTLHTANLTDRFVVSILLTGMTSRSTVTSLDGVSRTPLRRLSLRFALASRVSRSFHSVNCCRRFWDLAYANAGVGLKPIPLSPVPSSSGSVEGSAKCPVISLSRHVRGDIEGDGDLTRGRGCEEERICARGFWFAAVCGCSLVVTGDETKLVGCVKDAISGNKRGCDA